MINYKCENPNCENYAEYYTEIADLEQFMCKMCMDKVMISDRSIIDSIRLLRDNVSIDDTPNTINIHIIGN